MTEQSASPWAKIDQHLGIGESGRSASQRDRPAAQTKLHRDLVEAGLTDAGAYGVQRDVEDGYSLQEICDSVTGRSRDLQSKDVLLRRGVRDIVRRHQESADPWAVIDRHLGIGGQR